MRMEARTVEVEDLSECQKARMLELMGDHFENVDEGRFLHDLSSKRWVILLEKGSDVIGFSTQTAFDFEHEGREYLVFYSGDTIIERAHWGSMALPLEFMRLVLRSGQGSSGKTPIWMLTTKGFRTYRFLPVFYKEFFPRYDAGAQPEEARLSAAIAGAIFPERYDVSTGLLVAESGDQRLRSRHADVPGRDQKDPHVSYFLEKNPGFADGDELVCIAGVHRSNFKEFALLRALGRR